MKIKDNFFPQFDYIIAIPKSKDFFRYFSKIDKKHFPFRKFFLKNVLTFSKSGVIMKVQKKNGQEAVQMNAYNSYGYRGTIGVKKNRAAVRTLVRLVRAILAVIGERLRACEVRVAAVLGSFAVALGLVGGMESGMVPLYIGLPICLVLAAAGLLMHFED